MAVTRSIDIGGKKITIETGRLAKQANGAVLISLEDNFVLCTATAADQPNPGQDFFPLLLITGRRQHQSERSQAGFSKERAVLPKRRYYQQD